MNNTFSIIIPHKNDVSNLERLLSSIPVRPDVEIIVVDDDSKEGVKKKMLLIDRENVKIVFCKDALGAGHARNLGIGASSGDYLLFADSDDYYTEELVPFLDSMKCVDDDVVYFKFETENLKNITNQWNSSIDEYMKWHSNGEVIRFSYWTPWNKMVKRSLVMNENIRFEEVPVGNDAFFSFCIGKKATTIRCSSYQIYHYCVNYNGLTKRKRDFRTEILSLSSKIKINKLKSEYGLPPIPIINGGNLYRIYKKHGIILTFQYVKHYFSMLKDDKVRFVFDKK